MSEQHPSPADFEVDWDAFSDAFNRLFSDIASQEAFRVAAKRVISVYREQLAAAGYVIVRADSPEEGQRP